MAERLLEPKNAMALALVLVLAAGALGSVLERPVPGTRGVAPEAVNRTGVVVAQALGGIRNAAAAYIWIKLDEAHHEFYGGALSREAPLAPWYRIAAWLDPRMEQAFAVGSYIVFKQGRPREAVAFAREGLASNPNSALLTFNLGQLYLFQQGNVAKREALKYLSRAEVMSRGAGPAVRLEVLGSLSAVYGKWDIRGEPRAILEELRRLRESAAKQSQKPESETEEPQRGLFGPN